MKYVKKLSIKTVCGRPEFEKGSEDGTEVKLMQIFGQATGTKGGTSTYGDWECLLGNFEATNMETGETYRAAQLFMPDVAHEPIAQAVKLTDNGSVDFAVEIVALKDSESSVGYVYSMKPLIQAAESDPLTALREKAMKQLAAPAKADEAPADKKGGKAK